MKVGKVVSFYTGSQSSPKLRSGECVKDNRRTFWVRLSGGRIIKRHKLKHLQSGDPDQQAVLYGCPA